jgi:hypothetical protein
MVQAIGTNGLEMAVSPGVEEDGGRQFPQQLPQPGFQT